jgi:hypothetical protein
MIDAEAVGEILAQYNKHGWTLRRALLSRDSRSGFPQFDGSVKLIKSDLDALWFSRQSKPESEAWELRRLSALPFALVTVVPTDASDAELEAALAQIESDMRERTIA